MSPRLATRALIDNSAFAGVMRCYSPKLEMHRTFLKNYPEHREIDEASLADFLTAICIYQELLIESSSGWNDTELRRARGVVGDSWVDSLRGFLPKEIALLIKNAYFSDPEASEEAMEQAFDILSSPMKDSLLAESIPQLPLVYFAKDYVYRPFFEKMNRDHQFSLNEKELVLSMFLHRGLLLQSIAHQSHCVYLPYQYRGKLLSKLPPMVWARSSQIGYVPRLPLAQGSRPNDTDHMRALNEFYYSLLQSVTWTTYSSDVPFIGAAILAAARGRAPEALRIAMDYRKKGKLRKALAELDFAVRQVDRPKFESLLSEYREQLVAAAQHFGYKTDSPRHRAFYDLAVCWMPKEIGNAVKSATSILPATIGI